MLRIQYLAVINFVRPDLHKLASKQVRQEEEENAELCFSPQRAWGVMPNY
jgi:hypothetical protein